VSAALPILAVTDVCRRGSQVSVVLHGESPLHCIDVAAPKVDTLQGIILYSSSEEIRINFKSRDLKFPAEDRWRLDVWVSAIGHERMRAAIDALNYDPNKMHADSSSVREYELHGTYLREELLGGCAQGLFGSSVPANTSTQPSSDLPTPRKGLFTSDERVDDWVRRHSLPEPERKEGDPELPLNTSQTRAVAQMIGERFSLVQGVNIFQMRYFGLANDPPSHQELERHGPSLRWFGFLKRISKFLIHFWFAPIPMPRWTIWSRALSPQALSLCV